MTDEINEGDLIEAIPRLSANTIAAIKADPAYAEIASRQPSPEYIKALFDEFMGNASVSVCKVPSQDSTDD